MKATMLFTLYFLGTPLMLHKGQRVFLIHATNLPQGGYFAWPVKRRSDQVHFIRENAMHVAENEVIVD